jgi:hypothetical protein
MLEDDNLGSLAQTKSLVDNTKLLSPHRDLSWFLTTFAELGAPLGTHPNLSKTKILTSLTSTSPVFNNNMSPEDARHLCVALAPLGKNSEMSQGSTCFLGQPIGSQAFAQSFLNHKAIEHTNGTTRLLNRLTDTQTQCSLSKKCTQATTPHLHASDVHCNMDLSAPSDLSAWSSTFTTSIVIANHQFLSRALNAQHPMPPHSLFIASCPAQDGGAGLWDPITKAVTAHVTPLSRSTRCSQHGIPLGPDKFLCLNQRCTQSLANWQSEPLHVFNILKHCLPPRMPRLLTPAPARHPTHAVRLCVVTAKAQHSAELTPNTRGQ